jgi:hypothetical protein
MTNTGCSRSLSLLARLTFVTMVLSMKPLDARVVNVVLPAPENVVFFDNFHGGANPAWGNERGAWRAIGGTYDASQPNNNPPTYSDVTTQSALTRLTVRVKVVGFNDGGVWLRSAYNGGNVNGVLLVTGGRTASGSDFNGFYWHVVVNGVFSQPLNPVTVPGVQGTTVRIRIVANGNTYQLFIGKARTPATTLVDSTFSSGSAGLYDFSPRNGLPTPRGERFTDFSIAVP